MAWDAADRGNQAGSPRTVSTVLDPAVPRGSSRKGRAPVR